LDAPTEEGNGYGSDHGQDTCRIVGDQKVLMALVQQGVHKVQESEYDKGIGDGAPDIQKEKADDSQHGSNQGGAVVHLEYQS